MTSIARVSSPPSPPLAYAVPLRPLFPRLSRNPGRAREPRLGTPTFGYTIILWTKRTLALHTANPPGPGTGSRSLNNPYTCSPFVDYSLR